MGGNNDETLTTQATENASAGPLPDEQRGLYDKFRVVRSDGTSAPGQKHDSCDYFVLDLTHDPHALPAIMAYAGSCAEQYPHLAIDLMAKWDQLSVKVARPDLPPSTTV